MIVRNIIIRLIVSNMMLVHDACSCCTSLLNVHAARPCWMSWLYVRGASCPRWISRLPCPCCMSILQVHVYAVQYAHATRPYQTSMLHVHASRPCFMCVCACQCFMSMSTSCPCCMSEQHVHAECTCCMSVLLVHVACSCCMSWCLSMLLGKSAYSCCMPVLHVHDACPLLPFILKNYQAHFSMVSEPAGLRWRVPPAAADLLTVGGGGDLTIFLCSQQNCSGPGLETSGRRSSWEKGKESLSQVGEFIL